MNKVVSTTERIDNTEIIDNNDDDLLEKLLGELDKKENKETDTVINEDTDSKPIIDNIKSKQEEFEKKLNEQDEKNNNQKIWFNWILGFLFTLIIGSITVWFIDTFFIYQGVKNDYIEKTKEIEKEIELFKKDLDICNKNNSEIESKIEKRVEKEVELQISNKIIELKLNTINNK